MNPVQLLFAVHCHQPVGNFDSVYARAFDRAYRPFLEVLGRHPRIRIALHLSGPLLDWLERERPQFLADLRALVASGQVELLGGGLEEPILAVLPDRDAFGQLEAMRVRLRELFGAEVSGVWLAERVWEPDLPRLLAPLGLRYTLLDESHLRAAGIDGPLRGYYLAEKAGAPTAIFPIDRQLRHAIPYGKVSAVLEQLRAAGEGEASLGGRGVTFGDDGEKLGLWPGTWERLYTHGWLDQLFSAIEDAGESLESLTPSAYLARFPPQARVYVPSGSYDELMDWALPVARARRVESVRAALSLEDRGLVRGVSWPAFLAKYPEANALHKRMLRVSNKLAEVETAQRQTPRLAQARAELYRGQCNCAYWHGVFGGLYLPHLRHAAYAALIRAENLIDAESRGEGDFIEYDEDDLDGDLRDEAVLANGQLSAMVDPGEGGALVELDFRPEAICLTHVVSRREESYHQRLRELDAAPAAGEPKPGFRPSVSAKEPGLAAKLVDDGYRRLSFIDRFYAPGFGLEQLHRGADGDIGEFSNRPYAIEAGGVDEDGDLSASVTLVREGKLNLPEGARPLLVEKTFHLPIDAGRLEAEYILENQADTPVSFTFAPELNLTLLSAQEPERYLEFPDGRRASLGARLNHGAVSGLRLMDEQQAVAVELTLDREAEVWSYPVETVNLSEEGFERTYQGTCLLLRMALSLPPRETARMVVKLELAKVEMESEPEPVAEPAPEAAPTEPEPGPEGES